MNATSQPHTIEIEIGPDGQIKSTVKGVDGPSCAGLSKWLDDLGQVVEDSPTADYRKIARVRAGQTASGG